MKHSTYNDSKISEIRSSKKYNVLFLMNGAKPPRGGEFFTLSLIKNLSRDLFNPVLVYAYEGFIVREIKKDNIEAIRLSLGDKLINIYLRKIKLYNPGFILTVLWQLIASGAIFKLRRLLKEKDIHLIYAADNLSKLLGGIAGRTTGLKVVAHCHDDFKEDSLGRIMRAFYLLLLDRILTVSERVRKFFTVKGKLCPKAITVYNGVDPDIFNPERVDDNVKADFGLKEGAFVLGSIGVLEKDKGQNYLFEAIAKLKAEGIANIVCLVCGSGPEEVNLKGIVRARDISAEVLFLGYRNDIPKILKVLNVVVMTSLTIEACPMTALEAMSMKVPVIATKVGGLPEVVVDGETGLLIPPGDVDALCRSIKNLVKHPDMRLKMGKAGRERVLERFTIEENVRKTEDIFLNVLKGN